MRAGVSLGKHRGAGGLYGHDFDLRLLFLQVLPCSGHGAARADARDKDVHRAVRIPVDLRARRRLVDGGVRRIDKLSRDKAVRDLLRQLLRLRDGALHALCPLREDKLGAVGLQDVAALHAHGLRHGEDNAVALGGRDGGQADAGVAGGRLDDDAALPKQPLLLRVLDHRLRDAVLDAAGRVKVFQFDQHPGLQSQFLFNISDFHKGRIADQSQCALIDLCHFSSRLSFI